MQAQQNVPEPIEQRKEGDNDFGELEAAVLRYIETVNAPVPTDVRR